MLDKNELLEVKGGAAKWFIVAVGGMIVSFLIGVFDGYHRPLACNK